MSLSVAVTLGLRVSDLLFFSGAASVNTMSNQPGYLTEKSLNAMTGVSPTDSKKQLNVSNKVCNQFDDEASPSIKDYQEAFDKDGFVHVKAFYTGEELTHLRKMTAEIQNTEEKVGGQMMWFEKSSVDGSRILNRCEDFCRRHKGMAAAFMDKDSKLRNFSAQVLRKKLILFKDKINFKLPGAGGFVAHQDSAAGWGKYVDWFCSVAVFVDDSTVENGCLEVAPGYHKNGLLGKEWEPIQDLDLPYEIVQCKAGDLILFDSFVPHRSAPNNSKKQRRALIVTYNDAKCGDKLDQYFADKRKSFPPDIERENGKEYIYRV